MINLNTVFKQFKSVLCLNGEIPSRNYFLPHAHLPLIAADGAANTLIAMDIIPDVIVGDLDSLDKSIAIDKTELIQIVEQNSTDCEKALNLIRQRDLLPCLIFGATGKETDHTLYNLNVFEELSKEHLVVFHDHTSKNRDKYGIFVNNYLSGSLPIGSTISIKALNSAVVSSSGLVWELQRKELTSKISSTRNAIRTESFAIEVHSGDALIFI